jgi:hypothetical protein
MLLRLPEKGTDMLFTLHLPASCGIDETIAVDQLMLLDSPADTSGLGKKVFTDFHDILSTFYIRDWDLFSPPSTY